MLTTRERTPSLVSCSWALTQRETSLPRGQKQHFGFAVRGIGQHIAALGQTGRRGEYGAIQCGEILPRQDQHNRFPGLHDHTPGLHHLVGIAGAQHNHPRQRPQRSQLLDRLMRRTILAHSDRIMGEYMDHRDPHQRTQANRSPCVITEDEESGAIGPQFAQRQSVQNGGHRMFAHAEMKVPAAKLTGLDLPGAFEREECFG